MDDEQESVVEPVAAPVAVAPPAVPAVQPAADQPEVIRNEDGSSLEIVHTNRGWKAVINSGTGAQPEVFYGATKDEMWHNIARGKANATKQIRELTKKIKLGADAPAAPPAPAAPAVANIRDLTAEEAFDIKTQLDANPDLALKTWFQKATGLSLEQLVGLAKKGSEANLELEAENVAKTFIQQTPDYWPDPAGKNFFAMVAWLAKQKLHTTVTAENFNSLYNGIINGGHWTVRNLTEAFHDLSESGLLEVAQDEVEEETQPQAEPVAPAPATPPATPAPANGRIGRTARQPRAGLGTRPSATQSVRVETDNPPAAEDLDNLSDTAIKELFDGVRKQRLMGRRS